MSDNQNPQGRIVSFYSFKGGVGRTMALANVAFLAAMNDLRVLVMDWDLEAPGLHHYFRGLLEPDAMATLRSAPGVLDLAWAWRNGIDQATDNREVGRQFEYFRSGHPFEAIVKQVLRRGDGDVSGCLDIIPAGGEMVAAPEPIEYESALAAMSWNELLDRYVGGGLIDALRHWASSNYDLVLVDSRTGLADVAGICTMQLPDAVVLSFVLNRQNIEGVARVASAIRRNRGDALKIWAVPMRVSREGTDEEADATAPALRELTRPGRLDREATERDLKRLVIKAEPNVPFMESLSAFTETNAALDPLTANMARLASEITSRTIEIPEIDEEWRDLVSSRLAPTFSTDAYLRQLLTAEPERASRALHGYVEGAISTLVEGDELADDYVAALAETAITFQERGDLHLDREGHDTPNRIITLLRKMHERDPATWRQLLATALESVVNSGLSWMNPEDETVALDEIDELLAAEEQNAATIDRRFETRMRAARLYESMDEPLQQFGAAEEALALINAARKLPPDEIDAWLARQCDALLQRAAALESLEQPEDAAETLREVISLAAELEHAGERQRLGFEANYRLMRLLRDNHGDPEEVGRLALEAVRCAPQNSPNFIIRIGDLTEAVLGVEPNAKSAAELLRRAVAPSRTHSQLFSRAPTTGTHVTQAVSKLLLACATAVPMDEISTLAGLAANLVRTATTAIAERAFSLSPRGGAVGRVRQSIPILATQLDALERFVTAARSVSESPELSRILDDLALLGHDLAQRVREVGDGPGFRAPRAKL